MYTVPPPVVTFVVMIASNYFLGEEKDTGRDSHEYIIYEFKYNSREENIFK